MGHPRWCRCSVGQLPSFTALLPSLCPSDASSRRLTPSLSLLTPSLSVADVPCDDGTRQSLPHSLSVIVASSPSASSSPSPLPCCCCCSARRVACSSQATSCCTRRRSRRRTRRRSMTRTERLSHTPPRSTDLHPPSLHTEPHHQSAPLFKSRCSVQIQPSSPPFR